MLLGEHVGVSIQMCECLGMCARSKNTKGNTKADFVFSANLKNEKDGVENDHEYLLDK